MNQGRSGPRSKLGCWTCRARKVKCDESRPACKKCRDRELECDYEPRLKPQRRRRRGQPDGSQNEAGSYQSQDLSPSVTTPYSIPTATSSFAGRRDQYELPHGLSIDDWPIPLTPADCQGLRHYAEDFIPRMVLRTPRWSSYSFILLLCAKHALLAHLILAFSVRDMAKHGAELKIIAIEHYRAALTMFIDHLGSSGPDLWLIFPALWLFIHYEQQYGDDPRALQQHLEGVRDVVSSHGSALFSSESDGMLTMHTGDEELPRQIIDRLALWTIYHDASAATFGFGGGLIRLLNEQFPGSIAHIREGSKSMIVAAWGESYPAEEEIWDLQLSPLEDLYHACHLLRYELSTIDGQEEERDNKKLIEIGKELKRLEKKYLSLLETALLCKVERNTIQSNNCVGAAVYYALVMTYEKKIWNTLPSTAISNTLQACANLYEKEGTGYLWRIAWPMFVAGVETNELIYQTWVIERFTSMQNLGENLRRAKTVLEIICFEQRRTGKRVDYLSRIKSGEFLGFVI